MRLFEVVFSPTGGTQRVVDCLKESFCGEWERIDLLKAGMALECKPEDVCLVAVPSFGGRVPAPAVERLSALRGNGARAVLVCVYGNRAWEDTLLELKDTLTLAGFGPVAAVAAVAEHSIMRQYGTGRPDTADAEELRAFGVEIRKHLEAKDLPLVAVPGNRPYRKFDGLPMHPVSGKDCVTCNACVRECPVGAIPMDHPEAVDAKRCMTCMRCVAVCPQQTRRVNPILLAAASAKMKKVLSGRKENQLFLTAEE